MKIRYLYLVFYLFLICPSYLFSQVAKEVGVTELGQNLPYYEGFIIYFSDKELDDFNNIDSSFMSIELSGKTITDEIIGNKKNDTIKFRVPPLLPSKKYNFKFEFKLKGNLSKEEGIELSWMVINEAIKEFTRLGGINEDGIKNITNTVIGNKIGTYKGKKQIEEIKFHLSDTIIRILIDIPSYKSNWLKYNNKLENIKSGLDELFNFTQLQSLNGFINYKYPISGEFLNDFTLTTDQKDKVEDINRILNNINFFHKKYTNDSTKLTKEIDKFIEGGEIRYKYTQTYSPTINKETSNYPESFRLGLKYGIGFVGFNEFEELDFTQYILIRFYLGQSDKTKSKNYANTYTRIINRVSLNVGAGLSNLQYDKRDVEKTNAGIRLMTGLGIDVSPHFSIEIGSYFFNIQEGNPFNTNMVLRAAPYIGISFDANIIEFLKSR